MEKDDYSKTPFIKNNWPEWTGSAEGGWRRVWRFQFESPVASTRTTSDLGESALNVVATPGQSPSELIVTVTTHANAFADEVFFIASYRMFRRLEERFGRLKTIQGQPREMWRPFRDGDSSE